MYRIPEFDDRLHGIDALPANSRMRDFWRWAFSDLCEDYLKGFFAEWMVGVLLDLPLDNKRRLEFGNCDHVHPNGHRIEVKATALWQNWKLLDQDGNLLPVPKHAPVLKKVLFSTCNRLID